MSATWVPGRPAATEAWVRDPLASDVDGRLVVHRPPDAPEAPAPRWRTWPVPRRSRRLPVGWPIAAAVAGWPLWWLLGVTNLVVPLCAVPLVWRMVRRGPVRVPPGFWMWALFLVLVLVSVTAIDVDVTGAATSEGFGRYFSFGARWLNYLAVTVILLFVGNTTEEELPRRRLVRWMASLGVATVLLGLLALLLPDLEIVTPASSVLPSSVRDEGSGIARLAQMQPVLGDVAPRPAAPFPFTNAWGNNLSLLLVWLAVGWGVLGSRPRRVLLWVLLALALVPIVFSLNRGMWIGVALSVVVVAVRLAMRGRVRVLAGIAVLVTVLGVTFAASPLSTMVSARLDAGHSDGVRGSLLGSAVDAAAQSPVIGFGSTRMTLGSDESIAIGPSEACPRCGSRNIGSTGQLTLLLISQGFLGAALYLGFLVHSVLRYARDRSVIGIAGTLVVGLHLLYAGFYSALTMPLALTFLSIGLLWRNDEIRRRAVGR